jgi:hypothetical protein
MNGRTDPVRVTRSDHVTTICPAHWSQLPTDEVRTAMTPVAGGVVVMDAAHPDCELGAWVFDPDQAAWWLAGVFGESIALVVLEAQPGSEVMVDIAWGDLARPLRRLGMASWLFRWWPSASPTFGITDLDEALLRAEIGAAAWQAEPCLPDDDSVIGLLDHGAEAVGRALTSLDQLAGADLETATQLVWAATRAVLEDGDPGQPGWPTLAAHWRRRSQEPPAQSLAEVRTIGTALTTPDLALVAGAHGFGGAVVKTVVTDVDWLQVNPRMVADCEGNVMVTVGESEPDGRRVVVEVLAGDEPIREGLGARLYPTDGEPDDVGLPAAHLVLELRDGVYRGETTIGALQDFAVDVYHRDYVVAPRLGHEPAADRTWIRQVIGRRLVSPLANPIGPFASELLGGAKA